SFVRMARLAAPLMTAGGAMFAMSYYGANKVVPNWGSKPEPQKIPSCPLTQNRCFPTGLIRT
ncbi:MAG: hypothetical protein ACP5QR_17000, partial [Rhizomicrobium sp.]